MAPNNVATQKVHASCMLTLQPPFTLRTRARYIPDDFVLFSRDGSAHSTEFQDIDSVTRASLCAPLSRVRKRSTKLIAALPLAFETRKSANSSAAKDCYTLCSPTHSFLFVFVDVSDGHDNRMFLFFFNILSR